MEIKIIRSYKKAGQAKGLTVVIDVLRAFSTACFIANNNPKKIIPIAHLKTARRLKKADPNLVSIGERNGYRLPDFNYGNSPTEIKDINFSGKIVIHTTTTGTQSIRRAINASEIITGSFVNAQAIIDYIKMKNPKVLSFVCCNDMDVENEDSLLAEYIIKRLNNQKVNFSEIKEKIKKLPTARNYIINPRTEFSRSDFELCLKLDLFNFVLKVKKDLSGELFLKKI